MKKIFSLLALTLVAAISINASAQSSKIIGKWEASNTAQAATMEALGGEIHESTSTMTFFSDDTYETYGYIKATIDIMGVVMDMTMELTENGDWEFDGNTLIITALNTELSDFSVEFSDASLNSMGEDIKAVYLETINQGKGVSVPFDVEFISDNEIMMNFDNDIMPLEYTLTRIK